MKYNIFDRRWRSVYSTNNSTLPLIIQWQSKPRSRIKLLNSKSYFQSVHQRLVPGNCFERHSDRSKLNSWYWQNGYIPDACKVSSFWTSFVPGTHFYRQRTKVTKPAAKPVPTTSIWRKLRKSSEGGPDGEQGAGKGKLQRDTWSVGCSGDSATASEALLARSRTPWPSLFLLLLTLGTSLWE